MVSCHKDHFESRKIQHKTTSYPPISQIKENPLIYQTPSGKRCRKQFISKWASLCRSKCPGWASSPLKHCKGWESKPQENSGLKPRAQEKQINVDKKWAQTKRDGEREGRKRNCLSKTEARGESDGSGSLWSEVSNQWGLWSMCLCQSWLFQQHQEMVDIQNSSRETQPDFEREGSLTKAPSLFLVMGWTFRRKQLSLCKSVPSQTDTHTTVKLMFPLKPVPKITWKRGLFSVKSYY